MNIRYYYNTKILLPVSGRRLVYKFGPSAQGWRQGGIVLLGTSGLPGCHMNFGANSTTQQQDVAGGPCLGDISADSASVGRQFEDGCCSEISEDDEEECTDGEEEDRQVFCGTESPYRRVMLLNPPI